MNTFTMPLLACTLLVATFLQPTAVYSQQFDENERAMAEWIEAHTDEAIALVEETVNINSGTMNQEGVRKVGEVLQSELDELGLETEWIDFPPEVNRAGHLVARQKGPDGPKFLLIGHLDTVYEAEGEGFQRDGNVATGPGVDDMKAGNVVMVYALKALQHIGVLDEVPVVVFYSGDEEKPGEPLSLVRKDLIEAGKWADIALGFESAAYDDGTDWATIARRSSSSWRLEVTGLQAHSSQVFTADVGAGAIFEAARILNAFYEDVRGEEYLTFNAGTIVGGTIVEYNFELNKGSTFGKTNVVPQKAIVHGDIRTISVEQLERAREAMRDIVANNLPHTEATITFEEGYPAMAPTEGNKRLQEALSAINEALGRGPMPALDPSKRGAADISFVAPYVDALAGLGPIGAGSHSPNESLQLDSMPLAIKRAAILIYRLSTD